jgi:hypothetical protein
VYFYKAINDSYWLTFIEVFRIINANSKNIPTLLTSVSEVAIIALKANFIAWFNKVSKNWEKNDN